MSSLGLRRKELRDVFKTQSNIYGGAFLPKEPIVDIRLGSKYACDISKNVLLKIGFKNLRVRIHFGSNHPKVFLEKGVLKICSKFAAEHP